MERQALGDYGPHGQGSEGQWVYPNDSATGEEALGNEGERVAPEMPLPDEFAGWDDQSCLKVWPL